MKLDDIQSKIERIDRELMVLLQERMGLALRSNKFKAPQDDIDFKKEFMPRIEALNLDLIESTFVRQIFESILKESQRLSGEKRPLVAFQGEHGAYGEVASRRLVKTGAYIPCMEFIDVFRGVEEGYLDLGVVPVENSLEGAVTQVNDLLTTTRLSVIGEVNVPVRHCLLAPKGTAFREIRVVYSHSQALAQCRNFLIRNHLEPQPFYDTAGAAKMLARSNPKAAAAIASRLCADLYDLDVIEEHIEDGASNSTRFLLLSREPCSQRGNKTSIIFAVPHEAGKLYDALRLFRDADINLTRIASMPLRSDPGNYSFFLDFEGSRHDEIPARVLDNLKQLTIGLKLLGSYPADTLPS